MIRLFVALALPPAIKDQLADLSGGIPGARWVPPENYHLTLRFIGEVESWQAQDVDDALANIRARPFELSLRGLGTFEKAGRISALWVGVEKTEALAFLQAKVETALQRVGLEEAFLGCTKKVSLHIARATIQCKVQVFFGLDTLGDDPAAALLGHQRQ